MKIAMIGQKGIPAHSGGVEQHVDILSQQLVERGHEVIVYCRRWYSKPADQPKRDARLRCVYRPTIPTKHLDAITHSITSTVDVALRRADVVHYHAIGPAALAPLSRLASLPVVVTVHGLDWQRAKWGLLAKRCLQLGQWVAARSASRLIVVSKVHCDYFRDQYGVLAEFVPNGVMPLARRPADRILAFGIEPRRYILALSRLVPEKGLHYLIDAFRRLDTDMKLVIAGGGGFDQDYERRLRACDDPRVVFTGAADRPLVEELYSSAALFALPSDLEGMSIALLEAMSLGVPTLVSDIPENTAVIGDAGFTFRAADVDDLARELGRILGDGALLASMAQRGVRQSQPYQWSNVVDQLEAIYRDCARGGARHAAMQPAAWAAHQSASASKTP